MHCIVGLGNPEKRYTYTRHNVGFLVLDYIALQMKTDFLPSKYEYWYSNFLYNDLEVVLLKPSTYMNNSGIAVEQFVSSTNIPIQNVLIVCDDFQIPLGTLRMRSFGTDGGHKGLSSVIYHLQTENISRLRCGIASKEMPSDKNMLKSFVLSEFSKEEQSELEIMISNASKACLSFVKDGIEKTMTNFNVKQKNNI